MVRKLIFAAVMLVALTGLPIACNADNDSSSSTTGMISGTSGRGVRPPTPTTVPLFSSTGLADPLHRVPEIQLPGITGWINTDPLDVDALTAQGRVLLIDFWTYTCVNCIRTYPFLNSMHERYEPYGLTVIGVHAPEFEFERDATNVQSAVMAAGLEYPIALDSDKVTWDAFGNHFWPTKYLVGADGQVRFRHFGEGAYDDTEAQIRDALEAAGADLSGVPSGGDFTQQAVASSSAQTRELYAGYHRGFESSGLFAAQDEYYLGPDRLGLYVDTELRRNGQFELDGTWLNESDAVRSESVGGLMVFPFFATSANVVLSPGASDGMFEVRLDGVPVPRTFAGDDIQYGSDGRSFVMVSEARMYRLIEAVEFSRYELTLAAQTEGLRIHSVTFGVFADGP